MRIKKSLKNTLLSKSEVPGQSIMTLGFVKIRRDIQVLTQMFRLPGGKPNCTVSTDTVSSLALSSIFELTLSVKDFIVFVFILVMRLNTFSPKEDVEIFLFVISFYVI